MSIFSDAWVAAAPNLYATFGEPIEIRHVAAGEFTRCASPALPPFTVTGILDVTDEVLQGFGTHDGAKAEIAVAHPTVDFPLSAFGDSRPIPVKGTIVVAVSRDGQPQFVVRDVLAASIATLTCQLAPL